MIKKMRPLMADDFRSFPEAKGIKLNTKNQSSKLVIPIGVVKLKIVRIPKDPRAKNIRPCKKIARGKNKVFFM